MKRFIWSLSAMLLTVTVWACDQCSVSLGSGVLSEGHYIGYRFKFRSQFLDRGGLNGLGKHLDHVTAQGDIQEFYYSHELYGNYHLHGNWHITASIPLVNNYRSLDDLTTQDVVGLGDPWLMVRNQHVWDKESHKVILNGGLGVKLPLGATDKWYRNEEVDLDMQPGTGSTDLLANLVVYLEHGRLLFISQNNLKWNGESEGDYRYGNSLSSSFDLGYTIVDKGADSWRVSLMAGPYMELLGRDAIAGDRGGDSSVELFASGRLQVRKQRMLLSMQSQQKVYDDLDDRIIPTNYRLMLGLQYDF